MADFYFSLKEQNLRYSQVTQMDKRLLVINLSAMSIVVFAYYNADLTTNMTIAPKPVKIGSFQDVANSDLIPRTWPNTNHYKILASGDSTSALGRLYGKLKANGHFTSNYSFCYYKCMADLLKVFGNSIFVNFSRDVVT